MTRIWRKKLVRRVALALALVVGAAVVTGAFLGSRDGRSALASPARASGEEESDEGEAIPVKTIRPKHDAGFTASVEQPAFVEAYYQADLMARVAGPVKMITHDLGDRVKAGDVLVQIDVPDLQEDVFQREAIVRQRQAQLDLAQANLRAVEAATKAAQEMIKVKESEVERAEASRRFRKKELDRFTGLAKGPNAAVTEDVVDEKVEYYEAAVANCATARAAVKNAQAELETARAKSEAAVADVKVADSLVGVARKDRDKAQALLNFATVRAPFDGVVLRRNVDPGTFVHNATAARSEPLLTVARDDVITVYMKVPDKFAPFVSRNTEAVIQMDALPGVVIRGKVTRFAPSLDNPEHDRTMRVEVDLYNGSAEEYKEFVAKEKAGGYAGLKSKTLPVLPKVEAKDAASRSLRLLPGQYGKMRLVLRKFEKAWLLPRTAVVSQGGTSYVFVVKNGLALKVPVEIQADNGEEIKVALIETSLGQDVRRDLTGDEEIIVSNQGELSNGQSVKTTRVAW
jgi:multidrug resistance efflux pump